jgi:parvulin-like peptidyl-prolyl isomerase
VTKAMRPERAGTMTTARQRVAPLLAAAFLGLPACAPAPDPLQKPVAVLDGKALTVADLQDYLRDNLAGEGPTEPPSVEDLDRVKSRLFENFIDEEVLLAEARRRGIRVTPEELRAYLDSGADSSAGPSTARGEDQRLAVRDLTIQKLRSGAAVPGAKATPAEVDAYVARNREALRAPPRVVLRSFALSARDDAAALRRKILGMKRNLDAAAATGKDPGPRGGRLQDVSLESLPDEVRKALETIAPGQVTPVVTLDGARYLFYYQSGPGDRADATETLRARAEEAIEQSRTEEGSVRFLETLKRNTRIELHRENLPFRYVPEEPLPADSDGAPAREGQD